MNPFRKLSISSRLYAVSLLLIASLSALAISTWVQLSNVRELAYSAGQVKVLQLGLIASTELRVSQVLLDLRHALLINQSAETEKAAEGIQAKRAQISQNDADFLKQIDSAEGRDAFRRDWLDLQGVTWPVAEATCNCCAMARPKPRSRC